jgi:hypothetical protein
MTLLATDLLAVQDGATGVLHSVEAQRLADLMTTQADLSIAIKRSASVGQVSVQSLIPADLLAVTRPGVGTYKCSADQLLAMMPPPIGKVTITGALGPLPIGEVVVSRSVNPSLGDTVTLSAVANGGNPDIAWSWTGPNGQTATGASLTFAADHRTDVGLWTATATSATASDSPASGSVSLSAPWRSSAYAPHHTELIEVADGQPLELAVIRAFDIFHAKLEAALWYPNFGSGTNRDGLIGTQFIFMGARTLAGALAVAGVATDSETIQTYFNAENFVQADYDRVLGLKGDGVSKVMAANNGVRTQDYFGHYKPTCNYHQCLAVASPDAGGRFVAFEAVRNTYMSGYGGRAVAFKNGNANDPPPETVVTVATDGAFAHSRTDATTTARYVDGVVTQTDEPLEARNDMLQGYGVFCSRDWWSAAWGFSDVRMQYHSVGYNLSITDLCAYVDELRANIAAALA